MKLISTILILISTIPVFGQEDINQMTDKGQKSGKWVEFHDNGNIKKVSYYEPYSVVQTSEEAFFEGFPDYVDTVRYVDTLAFREKLLWTEKYEYDMKGQIIRVIKLIGGQNPIFLYGPNKEISIQKDHFNFKARVGSTQTISLEIENESENTFSLTPEFESDNFMSEQKRLILKPEKNFTYSIKLTIEPNENDYTVTFKNDSISFSISVQTFGYHVESTDIVKGDQITVENHFNYWRTGNEALFRLYDKEKENILKTVSLAQEKTTIDLKGLKKGNYWFCIQDFSADNQDCCELKIEK